MLICNKYFYKKKEVKVVLWRLCRCLRRLRLPNRREYKYRSIPRNMAVLSTDAAANERS
jgi:hypothetical protein